MACDMDHLLICLPAICIFFYWGLLPIFNVGYILGNSPLSDVSFENIFSQSMALLSFSWTSFIFIHMILIKIFRCFSMLISSNLCWHHFYLLLKKSCNYQIRKHIQRALSCRRQQIEIACKQRISFLCWPLGLCHKWYHFHIYHKERRPSAVTEVEFIS